MESKGNLFRTRGFKITMATTIAILALTCILFYWVFFVRVTNGGLTFENVLRIPSEMEFTVNADGSKEFDLHVQQGESSFFSGKSTNTLGVNGSYLGPTVRAKRDERIILNVHNELNEPTTMHWHGMHVPAEMDGTPHQTIHPGEQWTASYSITQEAGTMW